MEAVRSMDPVNVILCGAGKMGRHHLRVVREHAAFRLIAIVDPALAGGSLDGIPVVASTREVIGAHAAIIATPTETHHRVALEVIDQGLDVLIEKPLATNVGDCDAIAARAGARGVRVAIGHVERFNPAVRALENLDLGEVRSVSFVRIGGSRRCDVLHELAVHDLDLLERIAGRASLRSAITRSSCNDAVIDGAELDLVTERGAEAFVELNAFGERVRRVRIETRHDTAELDLLAPSLTYRGERVALHHEEPLRAQLTAFRAFLAGHPSDVCRIDEATRSVELADEARHRIARPQRLGQVSGTSLLRREIPCPLSTTAPRSRRPR